MILVESKRGNVDPENTVAIYVSLSDCSEYWSMYTCLQHINMNCH